MIEFITNGVEYTISSCSAVALEAGDKEENRQGALYVTHMTSGGERCDEVVFGWTLDDLKDAGDFTSMCEDAGAWTADEETLRTVRLEDGEVIRTYYVKEDGGLNLMFGPYVDERFAQEVCSLYNLNKEKTYHVVKRYLSYDKLKDIFVIQYNGGE